LRSSRLRKTCTVGGGDSCSADLPIQGSGFNIAFFASTTQAAVERALSCRAREEAATHLHVVPQVLGQSLGKVQRRLAAYIVLQQTIQLRLCHVHPPCQCLCQQMQCELSRFQGAAERDGARFLVRRHTAAALLAPDSVTAVPGGSRVLSPPQPVHPPSPVFSAHRNSVPSAFRPHQDHP
jgi:hypothetical protein